jgi:hypothetical protein
MAKTQEISRYGEYKLGDFGIARQIEQTVSGLSKKGTYTYMAPEVFKGEEYGASVDIYSLGIMLYSFLNKNRAPFLPEHPLDITPENRNGALQRRMGGEPVPALQDVSPQLNNLVLKACAYDYRDRFASAKEMREALEAISGQSVNVPGITGLDSHTWGMADGREIKENIGSEATEVLLDPNHSFEDTKITENPPRISEKSKAIKGLNQRAPVVIGICTLAVLMVIAALIFWNSGLNVIPEKVTGYGISVNSQPVLFLSSEKDAQAVLDEVKAYYVNLSDAEIVPRIDFEETVEVSELEVKLTDLKTKEEAFRLLIEGDPPCLTVILEATVEITEEIEYEVERKHNPSLPADSSTMQQEGQNGSKQVTYTCIFRNGFLVEKTAQEETIIKAPVNEIILEGTQPLRIDLSDRGITNQQLANMVNSGEIPRNVSVLILQNNKISDLTPLQSLTGLTELRLSQNQITNLAPLKSLVNLTYLDLQSNKITDIAPLQSLIKMNKLIIANNEVSDLSSLRSLSELTELYAGYNKISNISPLGSLKKMIRLDIGANPIEDLAPLLSLPNIKMIGLMLIKINEINTLKSIKTLEELFVSGSGLSADQINDLKKSLPGCNIIIQ